MTGLTPYLHFAGTAREALTFYRDVFGGELVDPLALKPWGDHDGQVRDRFGVTWLIGYQG
ncbi:hypothetical protein [Microbacterium aurum]|uniref:VOC family protein n=1 Tax=Microbacterium aurum TaxID=36805 RepID=A0A1P8UBM2_9MICO|nr:hypothetical protein [Microbacterium aurum]APZ35534.1 hypothetical protein BOH66_15825 [Microbacterium aurum]MBM7826240.1 putative glyoxalase superfamily protein PhnB [Microbacterium aurum]